MLIEVNATQAEMDEMQMTPNQLAASILTKLDDGVPGIDGEGRTELAGFDVLVKIVD